MKIVLAGSVAYDYLMTFPGRFQDHILPDRLDRLSLSFLVDSLDRRRGGIAANIAYTLSLLGERPLVMATVGHDFDEYRAWLDMRGIDTSGIRTIPELFTASFFVSTDLSNAQIASFYTGAMARASDLRFADLPEKPDLAVISANDPQAMQSYVRECRELDIPFFYDPGQQVVRLDSEALIEGITACRGLFVNDYEFGLVQQKTGVDLDAIQEKATFAVITHGDRGSHVYVNGQVTKVDAVPERVATDPTGVGDSFRGGFLKGYLHNLSLERCAQMGSLAATYCLENAGTQGHEFDLPGFIARFREHFQDDGDLDRLL